MLTAAGARRQRAEQGGQVDGRSLGEQALAAGAVEPIPKAEDVSLSMGFEALAQRPEPPGVYRFGADPGDSKRRGATRAAPCPVSATGSALGSVPTVALSSAQFE